MKLTSQLKNEDETLDTFYSGRIHVLQKKKGYRFSVDAPLLADFIRTRHTDELLELGTGAGIIPLLLSIKPFKHITALEVQKNLADMARRNVKLNCLEEKISVIEEDLRRYKPEKKFDIIFSNPPYIKKKGGHLSPSVEKSIAKHELKCNINDIIKKTHELLKKEGRAYFIYPSKRKTDLMQAIDEHGLHVNTLKFVCPHQETPPNLLLVKCAFSSGTKVILPPFILYNEKGEYTTEANEIFLGRTNAAHYQEP
ncbi:MAG: tRNA1(Val) (adenine(37)-N6)-methyltransferase [Candidatus Aminicenantaceae bacterium]